MTALSNAEPRGSATIIDFKTRQRIEPAGNAPPAADDEVAKLAESLANIVAYGIVATAMALTTAANGKPT